MAVIRQALQQMGTSMGVVVQQIYDVMDQCNDGQLRKLSEQGSRNSHAPFTDTVTSTAINLPCARR